MEELVQDAVERVRVPPANMELWLIEHARPADEAIPRLEALLPIAPPAGVDPAEVEAFMAASETRHAVLSVEDELALTSAHALAILYRYARLPAAAPRERPPLEALVRRGDRAKGLLIRYNFRLVYKIAHRHSGRGVPVPDLAQEGKLGMIIALNRFEPWRGHKFSTFATWWIRQSISRAIADQSRTIRVPVHLVEKMPRVLNARDHLRLELRREPEVAEIHAHLVAEGLDITRSLVKLALDWSQPIASIYSPVGNGEDEDRMILDFLPDGGESPHDAAEAAELSEDVRAALESLDPRDAKILRLRFGLDTGQPLTLEQIAAKYGLTRERIRQIEGEALRKLRHPTRSKRLRKHLA